MLCPVVDSTPALTEVLYRGATYLGSYSDILDFGIKQTAGKGGLTSPGKSKKFNPYFFPLRIYAYNEVVSSR